MFDTSSWMLFETALGVKQQELASTYGIIGIALVDARANFLKPAKFGDTIEVASRITEFRRSSFDVQHTITIGSDVATEGNETRVWASAKQNQPRQNHHGVRFPPKSSRSLARRSSMYSKSPGFVGRGSGSHVRPCDPRDPALTTTGQAPERNLAELLRLIAIPDSRITHKSA